MSVDPRSPILVGAAAVQQRADNPLDALQAWQLMVRAVKRASDDAGSAALLEKADLIAVPKGIWNYSNPAQLIANEIGTGPIKSVLADIGVLQQTLIGQACDEIINGNLNVAIVVGGEAKHRDLMARIRQIPLNDLEQTNVTPDVFLKPEDEIWAPVEVSAGLGMPVGYYALMESALCHALGGDIEKHRDKLAQLYEAFSKVAVDNPDAWNRQLVSALEIRNPADKNKMLAFPYTKNHNSQWNVDQAAALIFCSAEKATELGIAQDKWIFPLASTECNHMVSVSQRSALHRCPGARVAGERALSLANVQVENIDYFEMYSCFPSAVQIYANELGIDLNSKPMTVTGGMTFGGGPLNNYVLQATCKMAQLLRGDKKVTGLVTSVSGMLTKQGFGIWSNKPGDNLFAQADVTAEIAGQDKVLELVDNYCGEAEITAVTVVFEREEALKAIAICDLPNGKRTVAFNDNQTVLQHCMERDLCGYKVVLASGRFELSLRTGK